MGREHSLGTQRLAALLFINIQESGNNIPAGYLCQNRCKNKSVQRMILSLYLKRKDLIIVSPVGSIQRPLNHMLRRPTHCDWVTWTSHRDHGNASTSPNIISPAQLHLLTGELSPSWKVGRNEADPTCQVSSRSSSPGFRHPSPARPGSRVALLDCGE